MEEQVTVSWLRKICAAFGRHCSRFGLQMFLLCILAGLSSLAWSSATAAKVKGVYPVGNWLSPNRSMLTYQSPQGYTAVEYKIYSDFETTIWRVMENRWEDGTDAYVEGPNGIIFSTEAGGEWGYSNKNGLSIFFMDTDSYITASQRDEKYGRFDFEYDALLVRDMKISSYHCSFDLAKIWNSLATNGPGRRYGAIGTAIDRIGKFLAQNGVDPKSDKCDDRPELLNKAVVDQAEQEMKDAAEAASHPWNSADATDDPSH